MGEVVDGEYQRYVVEDGAYLRKHFFGTDPRLLEMVRHLSDDELKKLRVGGHDPRQGLQRVPRRRDAQGRADRHPRADDQGLRPRRGGRGQERHAPAEEDERGRPAALPRSVRDSDRATIRSPNAPFFRPDESSPELRYMRERRAALGGSIPKRVVAGAADPSRPRRRVRRVLQGHRGPQGVDDDGVRQDAGEAAARIQEIGKLVVPIVPDEARTFGMESLFRAVGIYSSIGQLYEPVDMDTLLYYKEAKDGQILEEGITEAGSMSSFIAAGTAYATHGVNTIPFFIYYSMFGFQRVGDFIWAAADCALPRLPARRHGRPHDARRRGAAAPGRQQPPARADRADLPRLRSGVRVRAGDDHRGRHQADVRRRRGRRSTTSPS